MKKIKIKKKFILLLFFIISIFSLPKIIYAQNTGESCSPWKCQCDNSSDRCIRGGFGNYTCQPGKKEGYDCSAIKCNECGDNLTCKRAGFGTYICTLKGANPDDYLCNPWNDEGCKEGEECVRVSWGHYECSESALTKDICEGMPDECDICIKKGNVWTALGCIPANPEKLIKMFFPYLLGIGGTIAFGFIVFGGIQVMTSSGDPEKIKGGKELITSALTGLVFIILSLFLLKLIGVDILTLPGLE